MSALHVGIVRYASVAAAITAALGAEHAPDVKIGGGRLSIVFRRIGASRWPEQKQMEHALRTAAVAREILAADSRRVVRERAGRAIVIVYEDATIADGCAVVARWECVVPALAPRDV